MKQIQLCNFWLILQVLKQKDLFVAFKFKINLIEYVYFSLFFKYVIYLMLLLNGKMLKNLFYLLFLKNSILVSKLWKKSFIKLFEISIPFNSRNRNFSIKNKILASA